MGLMWNITVEIAPIPSRAINTMPPETIRWVAAKPKFTKQSCLAMEMEQEVTDMAAKVAMECITCDGEGQRVVYVMKIILCLTHHYI
jgi:hypothetical protein